MDDKTVGLYWETTNGVPLNGEPLLNTPRLDELLSTMVTMRMVVR